MDAKAQLLLRKEFIIYHELKNLVNAQKSKSYFLVVYKANKISDFDELLT